MKASIRDATVLSALRPLEIAAYLRSSGWKKAHEKVNKWSSWVVTRAANDDFEVTLPLDSSVRDFAQRMSDILQVLEVVEERSQLEIMRDLIVTSADVVRVRLADAELADGTVPIEDGAQFFHKAKDMMLAAACAADSPRAYYPSKKPNRAMDYMRKVRLGQTEQGSFVLTIISRVAPSLSGNDQLFEADGPFERRVTQTLSHSLAAIRTAAESAASNGSLDSFLSVVEKGVSANLCDAITGMAGANEAAIEVDFTWSRNRPLFNAERTPRRIMLPSDALPVIKEAGRIFKETSPREDFEAVGPVVKLERNEGAQKGKVTVIAFVDEQPRKLVMELDDAIYHKAVAAHDAQQTVSCYGVLVREGKSFGLKDVQDFAIRSDD